MGTMYNDYHVREYRILVTSIIKDKLGDCIQFTNAPLDLEVVLRKQGNRYILHLVNFQGSMPRPMENLTPVVDLKVKLPQNIKIHRATSLMLDKELRVDRSRNELALPKLNEYDILVIE